MINTRGTFYFYLFILFLYEFFHPTRLTEMRVFYAELRVWLRKYVHLLDTLLWFTWHSFSSLLLIPHYEYISVQKFNSFIIKCTRDLAKYVRLLKILLWFRRGLYFIYVFYCFFLPQLFMNVKKYVFSSLINLWFLISSVLECVFIFILLICRFYTGLETYVGIKIVQTLAINLLTSIDPS